jgi:hypothetical protein
MDYVNLFGLLALGVALIYVGSRMLITGIRGMREGWQQIKAAWAARQAEIRRR